MDSSTTRTDRWYHPPAARRNLPHFLLTFFALRPKQMSRRRPCLQRKPSSRYPHPQGRRRGPYHGYAISQRIQQLSRDFFQVPQGSPYPALHRLEKRGWLEAEWKDTDTGREAKFYTCTRKGRKQLVNEMLHSEQLCDAVALILRTVEQERPDAPMPCTALIALKACFAGRSDPNAEHILIGDAVSCRYANKSQYERNDRGHKAYKDPGAFTHHSSARIVKRPSLPAPLW